jgi:uncharacterized protein GlcG (DUF336 family)
MISRIALAGALSAALLATPAFAQAPPSPLLAAADVVPDAQPFNIPYGAPIALEPAKAVIAAAIAEAKKRGWLMVISVVDSGANLVTLERMDSAQLASVELSQKKARAAALFRRETKVFETNVLNGNNAQLSLDGMIASRGGLPIVSGGKIIGAIGVSGGTSSQDEVVAKAGLAAAPK